MIDIWISRNKGGGVHDDKIYLWISRPIKLSDGMYAIIPASMTVYNRGAYQGFITISLWNRMSKIRLRKGSSKRIKGVSILNHRTGE